MGPVRFARIVGFLQWGFLLLCLGPTLGAPITAARAQTPPAAPAAPEALVEAARSRRR